MSPAAVGVRSPIDSPQPKQSNPSSVAESQPTSSFGFGKPYSGFGDAAEAGAADSARSSTAAAAGRPRARLVKMRRQVGANNPRSRSGGPSEVGSSSGFGFGSSLGLNSFCSSSGADFENGGFEFGAKQSGSGESLNGVKGTGKSEETGNLNFEEGAVENVGFGFGVKESNAKSDSFGKKELEQFVANAKVVVSEGKGSTKTECESKFGGDFVFGYNWDGLGSNSDQQKMECGEFSKNLSSQDNVNMKFGTEAEQVERNNAAAFVFGASLNGNVDLSKSFEQSGFCGGANVKSGQQTECRKSSCLDFVFRDSWCNTEPNSRSVKRGSSEKVEAYGKVDTDERQKFDNNTGVFVFGSGSRTDSSSNEGTKENIGNFNSSVDQLVHNKGPDVSVKAKCAYESGDIRSNSVSSTSSEFKLPDEMRKLNIDDSVNVSGIDKSDILKMKSFFKYGTASMPRRYRTVSKGRSKVSNNSSINIESCSRDKSSKGDSVDVEKCDGNIPGSSEQGFVIFGSSSNATDASGTSKSEPFIFQAGLGESAVFGQLRKCQEADDPEPNVASSQSLYASSCHEFQPGVSGTAFVGVEKKDTRSSPSTPEGLQAPSTDFKTPFCDPISLKESLFPELDRKLDSTLKNRSIKDKRLREPKQKLRKPMVKQWNEQAHASKKSSYQENPNTPGCYSPMDFSPYQETAMDDQVSRETSATSDVSHRRDNSCGTSDASVPADLKEEDLVTTGKGLDSDKGDQGSEVLNVNLSCHSERSFNQECPQVSMPEFAHSSAQMAQADGHSAPGLASVESVGVFSSNIENEENISRMQFYGTENVSGLQFFSGVEDSKGANFMFSATPSGKGKLSARKHRHRRKSKIEVGKAGSSSVQSSSLASTSSLPNAMDKSEAGKQFVQGHSSSSAEIQETCEKWRLRGNKAYENRDLSKAEAFYTQGIISVPSSERSGSCLKPLLLCYSNRAATRMCLLRIREAIGDCMMAAALDPSFLKVQMRVANCHLLLGEVENAQKYFTNCFETGGGVCLDRRIIIDAADGQQKARKVAECTDRAAKLLEQKNPDAALSALEIISEALSISLYSENLLKMKGEALIMLRKHEEVIQLCEQSLSFAEKNFTSGNALSGEDGSSNESYSFARLWRWCLISKCYFHLGKLEAALPLLDKVAKVRSINNGSACKDVESSASLAVTVRELLHHKNAGNEAFKSRKYAEAVDHYTVALSNGVESRRFAAICFCNRAAAHQALGQITDAIADCSLAIALDRNYAKAVSRRATLHERIRDYGEAASDLRRLVSILESQSCDKAKESTGGVKELRQAQRHFPVMEEAAKKGVSLDFYLILGSKPSDTGADIKKAYRKAALKHHPDKAGQFLARTDSGDEGRLWKEIFQEIHNDADRLFKMIGEAYAVLSDPDKRSEYDLDEELRKAAPKGSSTHRRHSDAESPGSSSNKTSDFHGSPFHRSSYNWNYRNNWKTHGNSYYRW